MGKICGVAQSQTRLKRLSSSSSKWGKNNFDTVRTVRCASQRLNNGSKSGLKCLMKSRMYLDLVLLERRLGSPIEISLDAVMHSLMVYSIFCLYSYGIHPHLHKTPPLYLPQNRDFSFQSFLQVMFYLLLFS